MNALRVHHNDFPCLSKVEGKIFFCLESKITQVSEAIIS